MSCQTKVGTIYKSGAFCCIAVPRTTYYSDNFTRPPCPQFRPGPGQQPGGGVPGVLVGPAAAAPPLLPLLAPPLHALRQGTVVPAGRSQGRTSRIRFITSSQSFYLIDVVHVLLLRKRVHCTFPKNAKVMNFRDCPPSGCTRPGRST